MRSPDNVFHLAIPCRDLDEAQQYYIETLGCKLARRYDDRITVDFFGDQLVCHLAPEAVDDEPRLYPRHFGITFRARDEFEQLLHLARVRDVPLFKDVSVRFKGRAEEHLTFFLCDPSNNVLEFKWYKDPRMMY